MAVVMPPTAGSGAGTDPPRAGFFVCFIPLGVEWEMSFFDARGSISRVSAKVGLGVFPPRPVFFGVLVLLGGCFCAFGGCFSFFARHEL